MTTHAQALAARADELTARREPYVRATVVRAQHPTSAHAGDTALLLADGRLEGFVGGNCVEASVRDYGLRALSSEEPLLLRVVPGEPTDTQEPGAVEVANPCLSGGAVEIFLQPQLPAARVVVVGNTPIALALETLGGVLNFELELVDGSAAMPKAEDAALIVASHGRDEESALEAALRAGVPYVGLVASHTRGKSVLGSLDVADELRARVHCPAGLDLGARTAEEVALSILAELVAERAASRKATLETGGSVKQVASEPATALDPVCGMTVAAVGSTLHVEHAGSVVYFCSAGCRKAFLADPERYAPTS